MTSSYNPFSKRLSELAGDDLEALRDVSEGWFVEYKSRSIAPREIAKTLTSFANQHGGYMFFGIAESDDANRTAGSFPGISHKEVSALRERIRDAASQHSQPDVPFTDKVISGPCADIGLDENSSIIVVDVPEGIQTPYVHSSGRIYRRVGDSSAPKVEADRYLLDQLWKRRDGYIKKIRKFVEKRNPKSRNQDVLGWFHLYAFPDPNQDVDLELITVEKVAQFFQKGRIEDISVALPMDAVYSSGFSICARQIGVGSAPELLGTTAEISIHGAVSFCVPINVHNCGTLASRGYKTDLEFREMLYDAEHQQMLISDFSDLGQAITALLNQLLWLKDSLNDTRDLLAGFSIQGIQGTIPYLDSDSYIERIKNYGFPTSHVDTHEYPALDADLDDLIRLTYANIDQSDPQKDKHARAIKFSVPLLNFVFSHAGVTSGVMDLKPEDLRFSSAPSKPNT